MWYGSHRFSHRPLSKRNEHTNTQSRTQRRGRGGVRSARFRHKCPHHLLASTTGGIWPREEKRKKA